MYQTKMHDKNFSKQDENGFQICQDEELTQYCKSKTILENDPNTILPPIPYTVFQVYQWAEFRCWILMHDATRAIVREEHNDFNLKMFIEAIKMSELGKIINQDEQRS